MSSLGIFKTVARTELKEKCPDIPDDALRYLNHAIEQAYRLGKADGRQQAGLILTRGGREYHIEGGVTGRFTGSYPNQTNGPKEKG